MNGVQGEVVAAPIAPSVTENRSAGGRAVAVLVRVESVRLLGHPITLVATLLYLAPWLYALIVGKASEHFPVLQNADRATQLGALFLIGAGALLGANLATLRPVRYRTAEQHAVVLMPSWQRVVAHLISVVPLAVLTAFLVTARMVVLATRPEAVGRPNLYELAAAPLIVLLMGVIGVLLGVVLPTVGASVIAYAGIAALTGAAAILPSILASPWRWILPIAFEDSNVPSMPRALLGRPAGAHVLYLAGVIVLVGAVALVAAGGRRVSVIAVLVAATLVAVTGLIIQASPRSATIDAGRSAATYHPDAMQTCQTRGAEQYCAFNEFTPWIASWDTTVQAGLARIPVDHRPAPFAVRQRVFLADRVATGTVPQAPATWATDDAAAGTPNPIVVDTDWGGDDAVMSLAMQVADRAVAGPPTSPLITGECGGPALLTLWLGAQSSAAAAAGLRARANDGSGGVVLTPAGFATGKAFHHPDVMAALALLNRPAAQVASAAAASWDKLIDPGTTTVEAAAILGIHAPLASPCQR